MTEQRVSLPGLVSDADHLSLSRLVVESTWRVDSGRAGTLHELFIDDGQLQAEQSYRGREAIRALGQALERANPHPGVRPLASNMRFIAADTDGGRP